VATPKQFRRRGRLFLILGTIIAAAVMVGVAGATVWTDQSNYNVGDTVQINGDGMNANADVTVTVDYPDGTLAQEHQVTATESGTFEDSYTINEGDPGGDYNVTATDGAHTYQTTFDPPPTSPVAHMDFTTAGLPAGTLLTITAISYTNPGDNPVGPTTLGITAPGYNGTTNIVDSIAAKPSTSFSFTYPATVGSCTLQSQTSSPATTGADGSRTTLLGTYTCAPLGPTADAGGPYTTDEGTGKQLDASGSTGTGTLHYLWSVDTTGIDSGGQCTFDDNTLQKPTITCTDDSGNASGGHFSVSVKVTDNNGDDTDSADLTVNNANPVVNTPTNTSQSNCSVSISATFTDAGTNDSHTATIDWDLAGHHADAGTVTETVGTGTGTVTGSFTYGAPGSYNVTVTVTDDNTGQGTSSALVVNNNPTVGWPTAPIQLGNGNYKSFNTGSAIPIKIKVIGCTAGLNPVVSISPAQKTVTAKGKSNLSGGIMRYDASLPGFIYNWDTSGWAGGNPGTSYTVTVTGVPGGPYTAPVMLVK
jgi:hypothetical protein